MMLAIIGLAFAISLGVGLLEAKSSGATIDIVGWCWCIAIPFFIAAIFYWFGRKGNNKLFRKEAMAVIGLGWLLVTAVGALPYIFIVTDCSITDAIFESSSGITTTGATVFSDLDVLPPGILFWRSFSQWIGGLGVVVFFVALLSFMGAGGKILYSNEASAQATELETSRIEVGVLRIFGVYLALSIACTLTYRILEMSWHDAVCHMFTTISTAGFSTHTESIGYFQNPSIEWACIIFMALGGTSFLLMLSVFRGQIRTLKDLRKFREVFVYFSILLGATLLVVLFRWTNDYTGEIAELLRSSCFQVTSLLTTTGYTSDNYEIWAPATHAILIVLMVIGGCTGSTAGGLKVVRLMVSIKLSIRQIERSFRSRVVRPIKINGRPLDNQAIESTAHYLVLLVILCFICLIVISVFERNISLEGQLSIVVSTMFNIGPGFAEIGPGDHYGFLQDSTKLWLSLVMIMARLEFYAILALFAPSLWKRFS